MNRRRLGLLAAGAVCLAVAAFVADRLTDDEPELPRFDQAEVAEPEWDYVIPAGTGDRIAAGEEVEFLPAEIEAHVGESIRIENQDDEPYVLGPWYVGAGETVTQRFASEGTYQGECVVHPTGQIRVEVKT